MDPQSFSLLDPDPHSICGYGSRREKTSNENRKNARKLVFFKNYKFIQFLKVNLQNCVHRSMHTIFATTVFHRYRYICSLKKIIKISDFSVVPNSTDKRTDNSFKRTKSSFFFCPYPFPVIILFLFLAFLCFHSYPLLVFSYSS